MAAPCTFLTKLVFLATSVVLLVVLSLHMVVAKDDSNKDESWKKKDIRDYTDADLERLYDQWEESDDDELEEDELPEWKKEPPKVDMSQLDPSDPESFLKQSKKGKSIMVFVTVSGNPPKSEGEKITQLWQSSLFNANIEVQRYMVSDNRAIFMINDGSKAWDIKDFLIKQERCEQVTIDGQNYPGLAAKGKPKTEL